MDETETEPLEDADEAGESALAVLLPAEALAGRSRPPAELAQRVEELVRRARFYRSRERAGRTREAYRKAVSAFARWCGRLDLEPRAPDVVAVYLAARADAGATPATLDLDLAAIQALYVELRLPPPRLSPNVCGVRRGIRREKGVAQEGRSPLRARELKAMLVTLPESRAGARDRALLLVGWLGAFRRSELVALEVEDLVFTNAGMKVRLRRSKTDPEGEGRWVGIPRGRAVDVCPMAALRSWLEAAGIGSGPVFREVTRHDQVGESALTSGSVARIVKRAARAAGLDARRLAGHSLRAGLVTEAAAAGKLERDIMRHTAHRSERMVRRYIREEEIFASNPAEGLL